LIFRVLPPRGAMTNRFEAPVCGVESNKKKGKLLISHRYNYLPLLSSDPGGVQQELVV